MHITQSAVLHITQSAGFVPSLQTQIARQQRNMCHTALFLLLSTAICSSFAFQVAPPTTRNVNTRGNVVACNASFFGGSTSGSSSSSDSLGACPPKSQNCIRTSWTAPAGSNKASGYKTIKSAIQAYPQAGQAKVDLGGWKIVEDDKKGKMRVEYTSGIGFFAKLANGGKPFIDDLRVAVDADGTIQLRSSSRIGQSDLGVNQKRLQYLAKAVAKEGWKIPPIKY
jgi:uncharacterized protein (DUF1499 family)